MTPQKIPRFNEDVDPKLFRFILIRKLPLIVVIFLVFAIGGFLLLRYTQPIFEAKTIIQIETENKAEQLFDVSRFSNEQFTQKIELLRSRLFIERVLSKLPLDVSYYNEGQFLNHELYLSSPFTVNYVVHNPIMYSLPIKLKYVTDSLLTLSFMYNNGHSDVTFEKEIHPNQWVAIDNMDFIINVDFNNPDALEILRSQRNFMFEINKVEELYDRFIGNIELIVLNELAKTIQISVRDKHPERASDIANKIAEEFQVFDIEKKSQSANNILEFINEQLNTVLNDLSIFQDSITNYKRINNIDTVVELRRQNEITQLNAIESELIQLQIETNLLNRIIAELDKSETPDALILMTILSGSKYQAQLQSDITKLGELIQRKDQLLLQSSENSSFLISINQQIENQKNLIIRTVKNIKINTDLRQQELTSKFNAQFKVAFAGSNTTHFELSRLERLYSVTEKFYNQLIEKKTEFSIIKAGYVPQNIILEKAKDIGEKIYPSKQKVLLIAFLMALFISLSIVIIKYLRYNDIVSASEINKYTSVPVLGVLPKYPSQIPMQQFIVERFPKSILAESLRSIRSNLQFITNGTGSKVIAVTSTISGEGKTFLSINMAGALAITGKKVIILDVDMRKPTVHKFFQLKNTVGMSTILSGQTTLDECIQDIGKYDIKLITAGPIPPNPAELLHNERINVLVEELKNLYDYIIIDNPPIGLVSDSLKTMQIADYPIYVVRANYSKRNFLSLPEKMSTVYNIKNLSIVLNGYDNTISNVGMEKDLVYAYGYVKGYKKGLKNTYYEQDIKPEYTLIERIKHLFVKPTDKNDTD